MVFKILDASAFYSGVPFRSDTEFYTTSMVYEEIKHIKKNQDAIGILQQTGRLKIMDPQGEQTVAAREAAKETGDYNELSPQDISVLALCLDLNGELLTDDFAISNVAKNLGIKISPIMTGGISDVGKWVYFCPGCHKNFRSGKECPLCGNKLGRKLLKGKVSSMPLDK